MIWLRSERLSRTQGRHCLRVKDIRIGVSRHCGVWRGGSTFYSGLLVANMYRMATNRIVTIAIITILVILIIAVIVNKFR